MKKYKIKKELITEYVERKTKKKMKLMASAFLVALLLMFLFTHSYGFHNIIMPPLLIFFLLLLGITYQSSLIQIKNIVSATEIIISEYFISISLYQDDLNIMNKIGVARNEQRYGQQLNQTIKFSEIDSTIFTDDEIEITSINYEFLTANGKICIPKEFEDYEAIKTEIIQNSDKYKLLK